MLLEKSRRGNGMECSNWLDRKLEPEGNHITQSGWASNFAGADFDRAVHLM